VVKCAISPSGRLAATATQDHGIQIWELPSGRIVQDLTVSMLLICKSSNDLFIFAYLREDSHGHRAMKAISVQMAAYSWQIALATYEPSWQRGRTNKKAAVMAIEGKSQSDVK